MNRSSLGLVQSAQQRFSESFAFLVAYRGLAAEQELLEILGPLRLAELYEGGEPLFSELIEISRVLRVPFSSFLVTSPGGFEELEIAYAELLYYAAQLSAKERAGLQQELLDIAGRLAVQTETGAGETRSDAEPGERGRRRQS